MPKQLVIVSYLVVPIGLVLLNIMIGVPLLSLRRMCPITPEVLLVIRTLVCIDLATVVTLMLGRVISTCLALWLLATMPKMLGGRTLVLVITRVTCMAEIGAALEGPSMIVPFVVTVGVNP